jgi:hypothetical protein
VLVRFVVGKILHNHEEAMSLLWRTQDNNLERTTFVKRMRKLAKLLYDQQVYVVDEDWRDYKGVLREPRRCNCSCEC